jgi:O-antigen ligase
VTIPRLQTVLLPLVLISVASTGITFMQPGLWLLARWILISILALYLVMSGRALGVVSAPVTIALALYCTWCAVTTMWSEIPDLTSAKAGALILTVFACVWGGHQWGMRRGQPPSLGFLWGYCALAGLAAVSGGEEFAAYDMPLYAGATANPNFLGLLLATSTPVMIWELYRRWQSRWTRALLLLAITMCVATLYFTVSRSAFVIFAGVMTGFLMAQRMRRAVFWTLTVVWMSLLAVALAPEAGDNWIQRNIYKQSDADLGIFYKREVVWSDSYEAAKIGGWLGVGYGISAGSDPDDLSRRDATIGYGREKGNSHLAIVEEIGLVGLALYVLVQIVLFMSLSKGFTLAEGEVRVILGLVIGTLAGLQLQSILEAWWVSPGSPEFVFFMVLAGVGLGASRFAAVSALQRRISRTRNAAAPIPRGMRA